jgi:DNA ligase (NAD+)
MISTSLRKKIDQLKACDAAYHSNNGDVESDLSDEQYDLLKDYVMRELPPNSPELKELLSKVGHTVSTGWKKEAHDIAMGSQNKVSNVHDIEAWYNDVLNKLQLKTSPGFILEEKIDGFSIGTKYNKDGKIKAIVSRGDGQVGENLTFNGLKFRNLPHILKGVDEPISVRGEGYITKESFDILQKESGGKYKNARNAAAGISRRFDGSNSEYIQLFAYDISKKVKTEVEKIELLKELGFNTVPTYYCKDLKDILKIYQDYKDKVRDELSYSIDGLVLKVMSIEYQERLGIEHNRPIGQVALKFSSDQAITVLEKIEIQVGRTGKLTPVGILKPVDLMGSTISKATLYNFANVEEMFLSPGAEVTISRGGDIIPVVDEVISPGKGYTRPTKCPSCGGLLEWDDVNLWCKNEGCREKEINRILYWITSINMKGFSEGFVKKLWDAGKVKKVSDLYKLTPDDMTCIDGLGVKTIKSFFETLESTKEMYLEQFITALGIPGASKGTASDLVQNFKDWDSILKIKPEDMMKIPGYAKISSETVCSGIAEIKDMAAELLKGITIMAKKKGSLTGLSFCVTGALESMGRKQFEEMVVAEGGITKSGVSAGLSYLVTNTPDSGSGKNSKVLVINEKMDREGTPERKTRIITETQFFKLAGIDMSKVGEDSKEDSGTVLEYESLS